MLIVLEVEYGLMATRFPKGFTDVIKFKQKFSCDSLFFMSILKFLLYIIIRNKFQIIKAVSV